MLISATWGLGSAIAQGEVVPDRIVLAKNGFLRTVQAGRKNHQDTCAHGVSAPQRVPKDMVSEPCLSRRPGGQPRPAVRRASASSSPAVLLKLNRRWTRAASKAVAVASAACRSAGSCPTRSGCVIPVQRVTPPALAGAPSCAVVVNCECELERVAPGDILITPALPAPRSAISCRRSLAWSPSSAARPRIWRRSRASAAFPWCSASRRHAAYSRRLAMRGRRRLRRRPVAQASRNSCVSVTPASRRQRYQAPARARQRQGLSPRQPHHPAPHVDYSR